MFKNNNNINNSKCTEKKMQIHQKCLNEWKLQSNRNIMIFDF